MLHLNGLDNTAEPNGDGFAIRLILLEIGGKIKVFFKVGQERIGIGDWSGFQRTFFFPP